MVDGQSVKYEKGNKTPTKSNTTSAANAAGTGGGSKGTGSGDQVTGLHSILKKPQITSQKRSGSAVKGTTGNQQTKKGPKTPQSNGS